MSTDLATRCLIKHYDMKTRVIERRQKDEMADLLTSTYIALEALNWHTFFSGSSEQLDEAKKALREIKSKLTQS